MGDCRLTSDTAFSCYIYHSHKGSALSLFFSFLLSTCLALKKVKFYSNLKQIIKKWTLSLNFAARTRTILQCVHTKKLINSPLFTVVNICVFYFSSLTILRKMWKHFLIHQNHLKGTAKCYKLDISQNLINWIYLSQVKIHTQCVYVLSRIQLFVIHYEEN